MTGQLNAYQSPEHEPFLWAGNNGRAALLVHGFPGTPAEMRPVAEVLHAMGWTTQGLLLPGFGREIATMTQYSHEDWTNAVTKALAPLRAANERVVLIGNSVGAAVSLRAAVREPVDGLLLFAPFWRAHQRLLDALYPVARLILREIRPFKQADFDDPNLQESLKRFLPDANLTDPTTQDAIRALTLPTDVLGTVRAAGRAGYAAAAEINAPSMIIQGDADPVSHPDRTRDLAARLAGPHDLRLVAGDHVLTLLNNGARDDIIAAIQSFALSHHPATEYAYE
jgi:carboxylesterase